MSEYNCFNCNELTHTSELFNIEFTNGKESLLCSKCIQEKKMDIVKILSGDEQ